jgi:hypothetical protein
MTRISTTPRTGQFAGQIVFTNIEGEGIFSYGAGGLLQHTGTGQTPTFRSSRQLARWLREHYPSDEQAMHVRRAK